MERVENKHLAEGRRHPEDGRRSLGAHDLPRRQRQAEHENEQKPKKQSLEQSSTASRDKAQVFAGYDQGGSDHFASQLPVIPITDKIVQSSSRMKRVN
jgi:hypothetical protein